MCFYSQKHRTMEKVQNPSNSVCCTPSPEPYTIYQANSSSACQEKISAFSGTWSFITMLEGPDTDLILSQINTILTLPSYLFQIHFNVILPSSSASSKWFLYYRFPHKRPPLWSSGQSFWLLTQGSRVRFSALPDFSEQQWVWNGVHLFSWTIWGATWKK
jgi:hypothetical protein